MTESLQWLTETMRRLGRDELVPSVESAEGSVWVDDTDKVPAPGYYEKRRTPLDYRILRDGRSAALEFKRDRVGYRIRCGSKATHEENLASAIGVLRTVFTWIDDGIATWREALAGFQLATGDEWWRTLRVPPDATRSEIDSAYRRLARKMHPDAGGTHDLFLKLHAAYEIAINAVR